MFILIIRALSDYAKIFTARLLLRSFLHYRNKLAERIFTPSFFFYVGIHLRKGFETMDVQLLENSNISRIKKCPNFNFLF